MRQRLLAAYAHSLLIVPIYRNDDLILGDRLRLVGGFGAFVIVL